VSERVAEVLFYALTLGVPSVLVALTVWAGRGRRDR
jgi:hypothetical protein